MKKKYLWMFLMSCIGAISGTSEKVSAKYKQMTVQEKEAVYEAFKFLLQTGVLNISDEDKVHIDKEVLKELREDGLINETTPQKTSVCIEDF